MLLHPCTIGSLSARIDRSPHGDSGCRMRGLRRALLGRVSVPCRFPDLFGIGSHVVPNAQGKLRENVWMDPLEIEPPHVLGLEPLPFFVGEAMARRERIR